VRSVLSKYETDLLKRDTKIEDGAQVHHLSRKARRDRNSAGSLQYYKKLANARWIRLRTSSFNATLDGEMNSIAIDGEAHRRQYAVSLARFPGRPMGRSLTALATRNLVRSAGYTAEALLQVWEEWLEPHVFRALGSRFPIPTWGVR